MLDRINKCRRQPLKDNRTAANFGNKDSSNKAEKPVLFCNVNMVAKYKEIMLNSILTHSKNTKIGGNLKTRENYISK